MLNRILVGVDGHAGGRSAVAFAETIAPPGAEIELVHVYGYVAAFGEEAEALYERQMRDHAWTLLEGAKSATGRPVQLQPVRSSSAARGLHERAEEISADLIVAGNTHPSATARLITGDTARALLRGAPCAVALVAPSRAMPDVAALRVAVGYDARPEAEAAVGVARDVASRSDVPLQVVTAVRAPEPFVPQDAYTIDFDAMVDRGCARARSAIEALGEDVAGDVEVGAPDAVLANVAQRSDVLVVGSRGYGPVRRLVLGSTSEAMVARAACTVIVVPRASAAPDDNQPVGGPAHAAAP